MKYFAALIFFVILCFNLRAQVPQSICYQSVATDQKGIEQLNKDINVRISILKSNTSGNIQYIELHKVTTDGFGLFNLNIGAGVAQAGGQFATFSSIDWGSDKFFLKIEIDLTNSNSYVLIGTSQLLSVPYALYAEKTKKATVADTSGFTPKAGASFTAIDNLDSDPTNELQDLKFNNGTMKLVSKKGDSSVVNLNDFLYSAPGFSMEFPLGTRGEAINILSTYTVPSNKYFFILASKSDITLVGGAITKPEPSMPVFDSGTSIANCQCFGILFDKKNYIDILNKPFDNATDSYTVPMGKTLIIKSGLLTQNGNLISLFVDGEIYELYNGKGLGLVVVKEGKKINFPSIFLPSQKLFLTGYLINN
jgi:hypothetical protein